MKLSNLFKRKRKESLEDRVAFLEKQLVRVAKTANTNEENIRNTNLNFQDVQEMMEKYKQEFQRIADRIPTWDDIDERITDTVNEVTDRLACLDDLRELAEQFDELQEEFGCLEHDLDANYVTGDTLDIGVRDAIGDIVADVTKDVIAELVLRLSD